MNKNEEKSVLNLDGFAGDFRYLLSWKRNRKMSKISICVLTYNPVWEKLYKTLSSIITQEMIEFEIIVSDDGSNDNLFEDIKGFFEQNSFLHYKLIASNNNEGTVRNCLKAVQSSSGKYIKCLSPGDSMYTNTSLFEWVRELKNSNYRWSFSNVMCYKVGNDNNVETLSLKAHPQNVKCYEKEYINIDICRWNYIVLKDIAVGAATLCERTLLLHYLELIKDRVIYAEDNVFRLMVFDGIYPLFFNSVGIWYEYGEGISTGNNIIWKEKLIKDWETATDIMLNRFNDFDDLQFKMKKTIQSRWYRNKYISLFRVKGKLLFMIKKRLFPRMTMRY